MKKEKQQIQTLEKIINSLKKTQKTKENFDKTIKLYGIINYSRKQYFPQLSSHITKNPKYTDTFYNYTTAESMILDLFMAIESNIIQEIETQTKNTDKKELINISQKILEILNNILKNKFKKLEKTITEEEYQQRNKKYTKQINNLQNQFYTIIYDEKIDFRVK